MTNKQLADLVDQLGNLKADIANLTTKEKAIKDKLIAAGAAEIDGNIFRATISRGERCTLDMDAVRAKLSPQFIAAHTKETPTVTVRVTARVHDRKAA